MATWLLAKTLDGGAPLTDPIPETYESDKLYIALREALSEISNDQPLFEGTGDARHPLKPVVGHDLAMRLVREVMPRLVGWKDHENDLELDPSDKGIASDKDLWFSLFTMVHGQTPKSTPTLVKRALFKLPTHTRQWLMSLRGEVWADGWMSGTKRREER